MKNKNMSKLFGVLVLGGAMMAQANDGVNLIGEEVEEQATYCQVEVVQTTYKSNAEAVKTTTCVDEKDNEEILALIKEAKEASCMTAFCGCWLG